MKSHYFRQKTKMVRYPLVIKKYKGGCKNLVSQNALSTMTLVRVSGVEDVSHLSKGLRVMADFSRS